MHDLGNTREYTYGAEIELTEPGRLLGHVELGLRLLEEYAGDLDERRRLQLAHCVLTHHGADAAPQRRFASPRRSRSTGSTRSTPPSRARWSTGSAEGPAPPYAGARTSREAT